MKTQHSYALRPLTLLALGAMAVSACGDSGAPTPALSLSFATQAAPTASARFGPAFSVASDTFANTTDTLIITKAQLVLRNIRLKQQETATCDVEPEPAGCEEFKAGPILLDLPLTVGAVPQVTINVPSGTYTKVEFKVHKVGNSDAADSAFLAANPSFAGKSIRVEGTFNGTPFTFETDIDVEQELEFPTPLVVSDTSTSTNLTVKVALDTWFLNAQGALIDPSTANEGGANKGIVTENIQHSMKAFKDHEKDGQDDDQEGTGH